MDFMQPFTLSSALSVDGMHMLAPSYHLLLLEATHSYIINILYYTYSSRKSERNRLHTMNTYSVEI